LFFKLEITCVCDWLQEIHKKIVSLDFRDCHAKIRQVDSQPTVGHGVVIQVGVIRSCVEVMDKMFRMPEPMVFVQLGYSIMWKRNSMGKKV